MSANTVLGRYGTGGAPAELTADVQVNLINQATTQTINAARVVAGSTTGAGVLQLTDSTSSTSTTTAATPNAVKAAYDLASAAMPQSGGIFSGNVEIGAGYQLSFEGATANGFETRFVVADPTADRDIGIPDASGTLALLNQVQLFTAAQRGAVVNLVSAATVTPDFSGGNYFSCVLDQNIVLGNPTGLAAGQSGVVELIQPASGGPYTVSYGGYWKFSSGTPSITSTSGAIDLLVYYVKSGSEVLARLAPNFA